MVLAEAICHFSVHSPKGKLFCLFNSGEAVLIS